MTRTLACLLVVAASVVTPPARADVFERYLNPVLASAPGANGVKEIARLTPQLIAEHGKLVPNSAAALVIVRTNGGLNAKVLIQFARQRTANGIASVALVDRFVAYKATDAIQATGSNLYLYKGFLLNLDLGQIVPDEVGGDLRFGVENGQGFVESVGKAKLYLVTGHLPGTEVKKQARPEIGQVFEARYFTGTYRLHDDGRRLAKLTLKIGADGEVAGAYVSEQSGRAYEVYGKVLNPKHLIQFAVKFPQSEQTFQGWMFTQGGGAIAGSTKLQEREFGFYALRTEEE